jgi:nicotinate phosphoribosyltransferase
VKQVYRLEESGRLTADTIALAEEKGVPGWPLLRQVMAAGRRLDPPESLDAARERCRAGLASLPAELRALDVRAAPPVRVSPALDDLTRRCARRS